MLQVKSKTLVSIITPSWNSEAFLEQTILSVINQAYKNVEHIIVDGGSTDGTLEIVRKYEKNITHWISEPDEGMYQAINKGMVCAKGQIVAYLNSDDLYYPNTISKIVDLFNAHADVDLIYGNLDFISEDKKRLFTQKYPRFNWERFVSSEYALIGQPAAFWRRELAKKTGPFDETMRMAADFDFFIRAGAAGRTMHVDDVLAAFRVHPKSLTSSQIALGKEEVVRIHSIYLSNSVLRRRLVAFVSDVLFKAKNWQAILVKCVAALRK